MDAEIKKVYLSWSEKGVSYLDIMYAYDTMLAVNDALLRCEEILGEAGLGIGYTSKQLEISRLLERKCTLRRYIDALNYYVDDKLDQPLRKDFKKNATETISRIHLEDFEVDNTLGLTENNYIDGGMGFSFAGQIMIFFVSLSILTSGGWGSLLGLLISDYIFWAIFQGMWGTYTQRLTM